MLDKMKFAIVASGRSEKDYIFPQHLVRSGLEIPDFEIGEDAVYDQGSSSMCAYVGLASLLEDDFGVRLSAAYGYGNREPGDYMGEGENIREALMDIYRDGLCRHELMPMLGTTKECVDAFGELPESVHLNAQRHRLEEFWRLPNQVEDFTDVMYKVQRRTVLGIPIYRDAWTEALRTGVVMPPKEDDVLIGGHLIRCSGKKGDFIKLPNSWGTDVAINGIQMMHKDYPIWEAWLPIPRKSMTVSMNQRSTDYYINGKKFKMPVQLQTISGSVHVPLRFVMETLGDTFVEWQLKKKTAKIYYRGNILNFREGDNFFDEEFGLTKHIYPERSTNFINADGHMLVPLRVLFEYLGWTVSYNYDNKDIRLTKN